MYILISGCKERATSGKLDFPISMQQEIKTQTEKRPILVYYHSGDCSFCYATIESISKEFPNLPLISISASKNTILVDYYLEQIGFQGISLIDSSSLFLKRNWKILNTKNLFLIDLQYNIITAVENLDKNTKGKIIRAIH